VIGALVTLLLFGGLGLFAFRSAQPRSYEHALNLTGIDADQHYTVIWDRSGSSFRDGQQDFVCLQLTTGISLRDSGWSTNAADPIEARVRQDLMIENVLGCIQGDAMRSEATALRVRRIEYFDGQVSGATAAFYQPSSGRLLFLSWQT
jgi:hypothetical protein